MGVCFCQGVELVFIMPQKEGRDAKTTSVPKSPKEPPSALGVIRVVLLADGETPTAALIEKRLRNVRQLYALAFILRVPEIIGVELIPVAALLLSTDEDADLDDLVPIIPQIRAAGIGSFWVDFFLQIPSQLPTAGDLHQWTEWLKNAHAALAEIALICSVLG